MELYVYPDPAKRGGAKFGIRIAASECATQSGRSKAVELLRQRGVTFNSALPAEAFPYNLMPGSRIEVEYDTKDAGLMVLRYYGPVGKPPAISDWDEDDEL